MIIKNRYQVIEPLASGGFGQTFLAEDIDLFRRLCVVKQLKPINDNPQIYEQIQKLFEREAKVLQDLGRWSDQIPELYAYFTETELFYLVQEWVEGQTLSNKIRNEGLFTEEAVRRLLEELLPILTEIHHRGIIHRDIKPSNLILRKQDSKPVLIDFGAVKEIVSTVATREGYAEPSTRIGTPGFMAPEQEVCRPVSPSSDLYSLGVTVIYLLTGKSPEHLPADQSGQYLWRHFAPSVSNQLAAVLDKAIRFNPADRYATAQDMLDAIQGEIDKTLPATEIRPASEILPTVASGLLSTPIPTPIPTLISTANSGSSPSRRPNRFTLPLVGALAAIVCTGVAGYLYSNYETARAGLRDIREAKNREDYTACISQSEEFLQSYSRSSLNPSAEAEKLREECSLAESLQSYLQTDVPKRLRQKNQAANAKTIDEIQPTVQISDKQIVVVYNTSVRPDLREEQNIKRLALFFMSALRGSPDQTLPAKHTDFSQLTVSPAGGNAEATITTAQWNTYLEERSNVSANETQQITAKLLNQIQLTTP